MKEKNSKFASVLVLALLVAISSGCQKLRARDELNKGIAEYKAVQYVKAVEHFKTAAELDPELVNARLYLATAYSSQYVPGAQTDENLQVGEQAVAEFEKVLQMPGQENNLSAIAGIASLYFQMQRLDEAKDYYKKQIQLDPSNPEPYYSVAVINWKQTYQPRMILKTRLNLKPEDPIRDAKERQALAERNAALIDEGMQMLNKAMELRPDYDDAMAYLNLLYREKADIQETAEARAADLQTADQWMDRSLEIKKQKALEASKNPQHAG